MPCPAADQVLIAFIEPFRCIERVGVVVSLRIDDLQAFLDRREERAARLQFLGKQVQSARPKVPQAVEIFRQKPLVVCDIAAVSPFEDGLPAFHHRDEVQLGLTFRRDLLWLLRLPAGNCCQRDLRGLSEFLCHFVFPSDRKFLPNSC